MSKVEIKRLEDKIKYLNMILNIERNMHKKEYRKLYNKCNQMIEVISKISEYFGCYESDRGKWHMLEDNLENPIYMILGIDERWFHDNKK